MKRFLLVDDHAVIRAGVRSVLSLEYESPQIEEAFNEESALQKLKENEYDLVILDIKMPDTNTLGLVEYIGNNFPRTKVLIFSMSPEYMYAKLFLNAGVMGFVSKDAFPEEIIKAIAFTLEGKKYISESLAYKLGDDMISEKSANPFKDLSSRELEIASLLLSGKSSADIMQLLNIHSSTVGTYKARIFEKLAVANILELQELASLHKA